MLKYVKLLDRVLPLRKGLHRVGPTVFQNLIAKGAPMIHKERIRILNKGQTKKGRFVLYWMQASQRAEWNHALEYAILTANNLRHPVVALFGLTDHYPEANERHYVFMLEGLRETEISLRRRGIQLIVEHQSPEHAVVKWAKEASLVVVDRGYLRIQKAWRAFAAERIDCPLIQVESDVIVPVEEASPKEEYAAATFRPKIHRKLDRYLVPLKEREPERDSLSFVSHSMKLGNLDRAIARLRIDRTVKKVNTLHGGTLEAKKEFEVFLDEKLDHYGERRRDPTLDGLSNMSPYLHFGQISPLYLALQVKKKKGLGPEAFLEELIVRRELSINYVHYNDHYDSYRAIPEWARTTFARHKGDERPFLYSLEELEAAKTHDPYWNGAQREMVVKGKMHGYMRMYWGKKIIEWSPSPEAAFQVALHLNNKYELDGRDPNSFAGVAWCFGKHDRPWAERPIFGHVRYMNDKGLRRKFDADRYVREMNSLSS